MAHFCYIKRKKGDPVVVKNAGVTIQQMYEQVLSGKLSPSVLESQFQLRDSDTDNIDIRKADNMPIPAEREIDADINSVWEKEQIAKETLANYASENITQQMYTENYRKTHAPKPQTNE